MTDADKIDNLLAQRRELMDKIEEQIDERGRIIERIQSAPDTPIDRLRALHQLCPDCYADYCEFDHDEWPCDTIAALDALEAEAKDAELTVLKVAADLWARIDAAEVLIREVDTLLRVLDTRMCGTHLSHFCDFSEPRMRVRAWLAGDKEAGNEHH